MRFFERFDDESGSAMTEFVIGLPVFIMIFIGMGAIHQGHSEILLARGEVNRNLWAAANPGAPITGIAPIGALTNISSVGDVFGNGASALGIYADSYAKTLLPLQLPRTRPSSPCATIECDQIGFDSSHWSKTLLEDNMVNGIADGDFSADGWASVLSAALTVTGSRPSFAAGIRYGAVEADSVSRTVTFPWGQSFTTETGDLQIPGITDPTHRILAVALTRIEIATDDVFNEQIPQFNDSYNFSTSSSNASGNDCTAATSQAEACVDSPPLDPNTGLPDASQCDDLETAAQDACSGVSNNDPLASIRGGYDCPDNVPGC